MNTTKAPTVADLAARITRYILGSTSSIPYLQVRLDTLGLVQDVVPDPFRFQTRRYFEIEIHPDRVGLIRPFLEQALPLILDPEDNSDAVLTFRYLRYSHILSIHWGRP